MKFPGRRLAILALALLLLLAAGCRDESAREGEQTSPATHAAAVNAPPEPATPLPGPEPGHRGLLLGVTDDPESPVQVLNAEGKSPFGPFFALEQKGLVLIGRDNALRLEGGRFFSEGAEKQLAAGLRRNVNQMTLTTWIAPSTAGVEGEGAIIAYGPAKDDSHFALVQRGGTLVFNINTGNPRTVELLKLSDDKPFHLAISVGPQAIVAYRDGKEASQHAGLAGHFADWSPGMLHFGNDASDQRPWRGRLERAELHNVAMDAPAVARLAETVIDDITGRDNVPRLTFEGTLAARSDYHKPWDPGFTYKLVLSVCEYKVDKVIAGEYDGKVIRVAEWMYVDRIFLNNSATKVGGMQRLTVERLDDNPQLSTIERDDTLELNLDLEVYYNTGPLKALPADQQPKKPETEE